MKQQNLLLLPGVILVFVTLGCTQPEFTSIEEGGCALPALSRTSAAIKKPLESTSVFWGDLLSFEYEFNGRLETRISKRETSVDLIFMGSDHQLKSRSYSKESEEGKTLTAFLEKGVYLYDEQNARSSCSPYFPNYRVQYSNGHQNIRNQMKKSEAYENVLSLIEKVKNETLNLEITGEFQLLNRYCYNRRTLYFYEPRDKLSTMTMKFNAPSVLITSSIKGEMQSSSQLQNFLFDFKKGTLILSNSGVNRVNKINVDSGLNRFELVEDSFIGNSGSCVQGDEMHMFFQKKQMTEAVKVDGLSTNANENLE